MSRWIRDHAFWLKVVVWLAFAVWIASPAISYLVKNWDHLNTKESDWSGRYQDLDQKKLSIFKAEVAKMQERAEAKGSSYGARSWISDLATAHELATSLGLPSTAVINPTYDFEAIGLSDLYRQMAENMRRPYLVPESERITEDVDRRLAIAAGDTLPEERENLDWCLFLTKIGRFLLMIYIKMMLFCLFWYPLRIIGDYARKTSFCEEILLAPERFFKAVVFWPVWFNVYGRFTDPARALRYTRLKVEYLRQKKGLEQLLPYEEEMLRRQAEQPLEDFEQALKFLRAQETTVKRSLLVACFWFLLGFFLAPFISPRGSVYQIGSVGVGCVAQLIVENALDHGASDNRLSPRAPPELEFWALDEWLEMIERPLKFIWAVIQENTLALEEVIRAIDHVPRRYCVFQFIGNGGC